MNEPDLKDIHKDLKDLVREVHEISIKIAAHSERIAVASERLSTLPCDKHVARFGELARALSEQAASIKILAESHGTVKRLVYGAVGFSLITFGGLIMDFLKK